MVVELGGWVLSESGSGGNARTLGIVERINFSNKRGRKVDAAWDAHGRVLAFEEQRLGVNKKK